MEKEATHCLRDSKTRSSSLLRDLLDKMEEVDCPLFFFDGGNRIVTLNGRRGNVVAMGSTIMRKLLIGSLGSTILVSRGFGGGSLFYV